MAKQIKVFRGQLSERKWMLPATPPIESNRPTSAVYEGLTTADCVRLITWRVGLEKNPNKLIGVPALGVDSERHLPSSSGGEKQNTLSAI